MTTVVVKESEGMFSKKGLTGLQKREGGYDIAIAIL